MCNTACPAWPAINFSLESIQHFIRQNFPRTFEDIRSPVQVTQHQTIIKICERSNSRRRSREKSANKLLLSSTKCDGAQKRAKRKPISVAADADAVEVHIFRFLQLF